MEQTNSKSIFLSAQCLILLVFLGCQSDRGAAVDYPQPTELDLVRKEIRQLERTTRQLSEIEGYYKAVQDLEPDYLRACEEFNVSLPIKVRNESVKILARLRSLDLSSEEKRLLEAADKVKNQYSLFRYEEEMYPPVAELAEAIHARWNQLKSELKSLRDKEKELSQNSG